MRTTSANEQGYASSEAPVGRPEHTLPIDQLPATIGNARLNPAAIRLASVLGNRAVSRLVQRRAAPVQRQEQPGASEPVDCSEPASRGQPSNWRLPWGEDGTASVSINGQQFGFLRDDPVFTELNVRALLRLLEGRMEASLDDRDRLERIGWLTFTPLPARRLWDEVSAQIGDAQAAAARRDLQSVMDSVARVAERLNQLNRRLWRTRRGMVEAGEIAATVLEVTIVVSATIVATIATAGMAELAVPGVVAIVGEGAMATAVGTTASGAVAGAVTASATEAARETGEALAGTDPGIQWDGVSERVSSSTLFGAASGYLSAMRPLVTERLAVLLANELGIASQQLSSAVAQFLATAGQSLLVECARGLSGDPGDAENDAGRMAEDMRERGFTRMFVQWARDGGMGLR